jgi:hypothetical protein
MIPSQFKQNTIKSFKYVRDDMEQLREHVRTLTINYNYTVQRLLSLEKAYARLRNEQKVEVPVKTEVFVASAKGDKYHKTNCPFAKNIKFPRRFETGVEASNQGFSSCSCVI